MADVLKKAAREWDIDSKDLAIVTDNASNMIVAAQLANFQHVKCYVHTPNLASQRALKLPTVVRLLGRVRRIVVFFHQSTIGSYTLEQKQKLLELPDSQTDV